MTSQATIAQDLSYVVRTLGLTQHIFIKVDRYPYHPYQDVYLYFDDGTADKKSFLSYDNRTSDRWTYVQCLSYILRKCR